MTDDFEREAELFRQALRQDVDAQGFAPLDAGELLGAREVEPTLRQAQGSGEAQGSGKAQRSGSARGSRRPRDARRRVTVADWGRGIVAAAAAVALIALGATVVPWLFGRSGTASTPAVPAAGTTAAGTAAAAPEADTQSTSAAAGPLGGAAPGVREGWRWESYRDVMVQVPAEWGYGMSLTTAWCATVDGSGVPEPATGPFVDLRRGDEPIAAIGCQGEPPSAAQAMHLSFRPATAEYAEVLGKGDWAEYRLDLGAARLIVVAEPADAALAQQILDSAVQVSSDDNGCPAVEPARGSADIARLAPDVIPVCLYDTFAEPGPNLRSSVRLEGERAAAALAAIEAAPGGGGPDGDPADCGTSGGASRAVLLLDGAAVGFDFAGCAGNGLADSGAAGGLRRVTGDLCRALLVDPATIWYGTGPAAQACLSAIHDR